MGHDHKHKFDPANAARLDDPERRALMPPEVLIAAAPAHAGEVIADVGCGTGYWTFAYLERSPEDVRILAVDTEPRMLDLLRERLGSHPGRGRVRLIHSFETTIPLEDACVHLAVLGHLYHELADRRAFLAEMRRILVPGGRIAIVDWEVLPAEVQPLRGPPNDERVAFGTAMEEVLSAGFEDVRPVTGFIQIWGLVATRPLRDDTFGP